MRGRAGNFFDRSPEGTNFTAEPAEGAQGHRRTSFEVISTERGHAMICKKCGKAMVEEKRSFHKKRKWVCKNCGNVVMQKPKCSDS